MWIQVLDFFVRDHGTSIDVRDYAPERFWKEWNDELKAPRWHRVELDRDGNPYTIKWDSTAYQSRGAGWVVMTGALVAEGSHARQAITAREGAAPAQKPSMVSPQPSATQPTGGLAAGTRLRNPAGTWTVSWYRQASAQCGEYLLTHEDGHQETWKASDMVTADFHLILADEQQYLDVA